VNGALQDQQVQTGVDAMGNPIFSPVTVDPPMSAAGARASRFFSEFDAGGTHAGYLSTAELRLLAEWLDIGAQYCNNPFATTGCPVN
jgi:enoyl reductase-like protein